MVDGDSPASTTPPNAPNATIRSLFLAALFNALPDKEVELKALLDEHGVFRSQVTSPYERLPLHRYVSLVEGAAAKFGRPFLGLEMGAKFGLTELGPFHALFSSCADLRDAFVTLARFQSRWQTRTLFNEDRGAEFTTYSYMINDPAIWPRRQDAEFTIAGMVTLVKQLTTMNWTPVEVHFEHSVAARERHLHSFFKAPVLGSQAANRFVIRNEDLDKPLLGSVRLEGSRLKSILETHLLDLMRQQTAPSQGVVGQTAEIIARRLGDASVSCEVVASDLNLSVRSLRRRLVEEGTSFRQVLQEARQARAKTMLEDTEVPLAAAAKVLGYSDTATFSRAFKQWTGVPPRRFGRKGS